MKRSNTSVGLNIIAARVAHVFLITVQGLDSDLIQNYQRVEAQLQFGILFTEAVVWRTGVGIRSRHKVSERMELRADFSKGKRIGIHSHSNEGCRINTHLTNTPLSAHFFCLSKA